MPFVETNGIRLHYVEYSTSGPLLILMHGLTANAYAFEGIVAEGLDKHFRVVSVDLRGRGLSDAPVGDYTMESHAQDILGLLDALGTEKASFVGHSFGGLLSFYLGAYYPERVERLVILDAAARMNPRAPEMLSFRFSTLDMLYPTMTDYMSAVKAAPYNKFWSKMMDAYYDADVVEQDGGGVMPRPKLANIIQASMGVGAIDWPGLVPMVKAPVLLVNAVEEYTLGEALLPPELARETVEMLADGRMITVAGNHQTMLYGEGAREICKAVVGFAVGTV
jgi:pimeloyl-ACP methyl ester carboxylesterase